MGLNSIKNGIRAIYNVQKILFLVRMYGHAGGDKTNYSNREGRVCQSIIGPSCRNNRMHLYPLTTNTLATLSHQSLLHSTGEGQTWGHCFQNSNLRRKFASTTLCHFVLYVWQEIGFKCIILGVQGIDKGRHSSSWMAPQQFICVQSRRCWPPLAGLVPGLSCPLSIWTPEIKTHLHPLYHSST